MFLLITISKVHIFSFWCRNGIHQRLDSWQDGVSGTNCPIPPGWNWTYDFQVKDQIGTFSYFPSINFLKAGGGYGPIRVNNRPVISVPFPKPEAEFDLLIGDWYSTSYKVTPCFLALWLSMILTFKHWHYYAFSNSMQWYFIFWSLIYW